MLPSQIPATSTGNPSQNERGWVDHIPLEARLEIVAQAAEALQAAHEAGVIHRDVKPANILIAECGVRSAESANHKLTAKLTDFGIGQVVSEELLAGVTRAGFTQTMVGSTSAQTGTQLYMAPELLAGKPASTRSDISPSRRKRKLPKQRRLPRRGSWSGSKLSGTCTWLT